MVVLLWLGLPYAAPQSPLLGALRPIPIGVCVILDWFFGPQGPVFLYQGMDNLGPWVAFWAWAPYMPFLSMNVLSWPRHVVTRSHAPDGGGS